MNEHYCTYEDEYESDPNCYKRCSYSGNCHHRNEMVEKDESEKSKIESQIIPLGEQLEDLSKIAISVDSTIDAGEAVKLLRAKVIEAINNKVYTVIQTVVEEEAKKLLAETFKATIVSQIEKIAVEAFKEQLNIVDPTEVAVRKQSIHDMISIKFKEIFRSAKNDRRDNLKDRAVSEVIKSSVDEQVGDAVAELKADFQEKMQKEYIKTLMQSFAGNIANNKALMDSLISNN